MKAAGCNSHGHSLLKSMHISSEHSEEEEENTVKTNQAFCVRVIPSILTVVLICTFPRKK